MPANKSAREKAVTAAVAAYRNAGDAKAKKFREIDELWDSIPPRTLRLTQALTPEEKAHNAQVEKARRAWLQHKLEILLDIRKELDEEIERFRSNLGWY